MIPNQPPLFLTIADGPDITDILIRSCEDVSGIVSMEICTYIIQKKVRLCILNLNVDEGFYYIQTHYTKT